MVGLDVKAVLGEAGRLAARFGDEAYYVAMCVQSGLIGVERPHRVAKMLRAFERYGAIGGVQFEGYTGGGTKEMTGGLMASGDLGHFDAAGRLFIDGRDDEMIVSGGENVFPRESEELLARHDAIAEAAAVGVPARGSGSACAPSWSSATVPRSPSLRDHAVRRRGATDDLSVVRTS